MSTLEKPLTEIELGDLLRSCTGGQSGLVRRLAFERDLLKEQLTALQWRPIAEYGMLQEEPTCVFAYRANNGLTHISDCQQFNAFGKDTHFLQLPPVPGENES